jgi:hypothetical protein
MNLYAVKVAGRASLRILGHSIEDAVERGLDEIVTAAGLRNAAGYRVESLEFMAAEKPEGAMWLDIATQGLELAHGRQGLRYAGRVLITADNSGGRPTVDPTGRPMTRVLVQLTQAQLDQLDQRGRAQEISRAEVVRRIVDQALG